jgi:hypothetical protein
MKSTWYGKEFYWVELPRRFMVTMWVTTMMLMMACLKQGYVLPHLWIIFVLAIITDIFTSWRAPDVKITEEEIEDLASSITRPIYIPTGELVGKTQREVDEILDKADRFYFLTVKEVCHRFFVLCGSSVLLSWLFNYCFINDQEPYVFTTLTYTFMIACQLAFFSAKGITLKTKNMLSKKDKSFKIEGYTTLATRSAFLAIGNPFGIYLINIIMLAVLVITLDDKSINSQEFIWGRHRFTLIFILFLFMASVCQYVISLHILDSKIRHVLSKK